MQRSELKRPIAFGVPVTTLVGYYDPEPSLTSYVYPALHGSYGFIYRDDSGSLNDQQCQLVVSTNQGERRFRLSPVRMQAGSMNKYHVNLPASEQASRAEVRCAGQVLASRQLEGPRTQLQTKVLGLSLS